MQFYLDYTLFSQSSHMFHSPTHCIQNTQSHRNLSHTIQDAPGPPKHTQAHQIHHYPTFFFSKAVLGFPSLSKLTQCPFSTSSLSTLFYPFHSNHPETFQDLHTYFTLFKLLKLLLVLKSHPRSPSLSSLLEVSPSLYFHVKLYYLKILKRGPYRADNIGSLAVYHGQFQLCKR